MEEYEMTRAEEAALKAYPVKMTPLVYQDLIDQFGGKTEIDISTYPRCLFQQGYEQAEKDLGWHSVEESLPPIDEEVIVLVDNVPIYPIQFTNKLDAFPIYKITFGHIVNSKYCEAYDTGGWNIPGVKYWMRCPKIPNE